MLWKHESNTGTDIREFWQRRYTNNAYNTVENTEIGRTVVLNPRNNTAIAGMYKLFAVQAGHFYIMRTTMNNTNIDSGASKYGNFVYITWFNAENNIIDEAHEICMDCNSNKGVTTKFAEKWLWLYAPEGAVKLKIELCNHRTSTQGTTCTRWHNLLLNEVLNYENINYVSPIANDNKTYSSTEPPVGDDDNFKMIGDIIYNTDFETNKNIEYWLLTSKDGVTPTYTAK